LKLRGHAGVKRWRVVDADADDSALAGDAKTAATSDGSDKTHTTAIRHE